MAKPGNAASIRLNARGSAWLTMRAMGRLRLLMDMDAYLRGIIVELESE
jgi:hypothetical protein